MADRYSPVSPTRLSGVLAIGRASTKANVKQSRHEIVNGNAAEDRVLRGSLTRSHRQLYPSSASLAHCSPISQPVRVLPTAGCG